MTIQEKVLRLRGSPLQLRRRLRLTLTLLLLRLCLLANGRPTVQAGYRARYLLRLNLRRRQVYGRLLRLLRQLLLWLLRRRSLLLRLS